jgi:hypothetical protein
MKNFKIDITFDPSSQMFVYKDENGNDAKTKKHANKDDTIKWRLSGYGAKLIVDFPDNKDGNPFAPSTTTFLANTGSYTDKGTFNGNHKSLYNYNVTATDGSGRVLHSEDPQIMFDDGTLRETDLKIFDNSIETIVQSAHKVSDALFAQLKDAASVKGDPQGKFFPKGINLISVEVEVGTLKVIVKVAGPGVSGADQKTEE